MVRWLRFGGGRSGLLEGDALVDFTGQLIEFSVKSRHDIRSDQASGVSAAQPVSSFLKRAPGEVKEVSHIGWMESACRLSDVRPD